MTKFENLSRGAKNIITELFGDGPLTRGAAIESLEGGEVLAKNGAAAEALEYLETISVTRGTELALYEVRDAVRAADPFSYGDEALERRLLDCYDDFTLGLFPSDGAAAVAAEDRQHADDAKAEKLGEGALGKDFALSGGPAYRNHIFKWTAEAVEPVEL